MTLIFIRLPEVVENTRTCKISSSHVQRFMRYRVDKRLSAMVKNPVMWPWPWYSIGFYRLPKYIFTQNFIKLSAAVRELLRKQRNREKKNLRDDAENNTAFTSTGSNNTIISREPLSRSCVRLSTYMNHVSNSTAYNTYLWTEFSRHSTEQDKTARSSSL